MAIPIRVTITCPTCGVSEDVTFGDTSVGPRGRVSDTPIYSMFTNDPWPQTKTEVDGQKITYISCASCGEKNFATLAGLARQRGPAPRSDGGKQPTLSAAPSAGPRPKSKPISRN